MRMVCTTAISPPLLSAVLSVLRFVMVLKVFVLVVKHFVIIVCVTAFIFSLFLCVVEDCWNRFACFCFVEWFL